MTEIIPEQKVMSPKRPLASPLAKVSPPSPAPAKSNMLHLQPPIPFPPVTTDYPRLHAVANAPVLDDSVIPVPEVADTTLPEATTPIEADSSSVKRLREDEDEAGDSLMNARNESVADQSSLNVQSPEQKKLKMDSRENDAEEMFLDFNESSSELPIVNVEVAEVAAESTVQVVKQLVQRVPEATAPPATAPFVEESNETIAALLTQPAVSEVNAESKGTPSPLFSLINKKMADLKENKKILEEMEKKKLLSSLGTATPPQPTLPSTDSTIKQSPAPIKPISPTFEKPPAIVPFVGGARSVSIVPSRVKPTPISQPSVRRISVSPITNTAGAGSPPAGSVRGIPRGRIKRGGKGVARGSGRGRGVGDQGQQPKST